MHFDSRIFILFAANLLLLFLTMLVNSRLAPFSLYLIVLGPMVVIPALYLKYPALISCCFITGISIDALLPLPFWLFVYGLPVAGLLIRSIRGHFRTETSYRFVLLAHVANIACIVLLVLSQSAHFGQLSVSLIQILVMTLLSHTILTIVAPWFFSFENLLFKFLKTEYASEDEFLIP